MKRYNKERKEKHDACCETFFQRKFIVGGRLLASHGIRTSVLPALDNGQWEWQPLKDLSMIKIGEGRNENT